MSEQSYQLNVKRGVTGPETETCLLAAYDRITSRGEVRPETYQQYQDLRRQYVEATNDAPEFIPIDIIRDFRQIKEQFRRELGVAGTKNIVCVRAKTKDELYHSLGNLSQGGFRPAVYLDTDGLHAVGTISLDDEYYDLRSTVTPFEEDMPVSVGEIYEYLYQFSRIHKKVGGRRTHKESNIIALPPEPRT
jgi:hypothetical protein